jgi:hypothetical protein
VWADREALGGAITEIDTTAVLTRHDGPIDNPSVEIGASPWASTVTHHHNRAAALRMLEAARPMRFAIREAIYS